MTNLTIDMAFLRTIGIMNLNRCHTQMATTMGEAFSHLTTGRPHRLSPETGHLARHPFILSRLIHFRIQRLYYATIPIVVGGYRGITQHEVTILREQGPWVGLHRIIIATIRHVLQIYAVESDRIIYLHHVLPKQLAMLSLGLRVVIPATISEKI